MRSNLYINGQDAYQVYGVVMGTGFIDAIESGTQLKEPIENDCRHENGTRTLVNTKKAKRNITLKFNIHGSSSANFLENKRKFENMLYNGMVDMQIRGRSEVYHLVYTGKSVTYRHSYNGKFGIWAASFSEPNPANRTASANAYVRVFDS